MKKLILCTCLIITGCASQQYHGEQRAALMSDIYLCKNFDGETPEEIKKAEIEKRGLDCDKILEKHDAAQAKAAEAAKRAKKKQEQQYAEQTRLRAKRPQIKNVYDRVLSDSIDQYHIVDNNGGSQIDLCAQAGLVKAAALQAKNQEFYRYWNDVTKLHCAIAGVPY